MIEPVGPTEIRDLLKQITEDLGALTKFVKQEYVIADSLSYSAVLVGAGSVGDLCGVVSAWAWTLLVLEMAAYVRHRVTHD